MIITGSQIGMSAAHHRQEQIHERESLQRFQADAAGNVAVVATETSENRGRKLAAAELGPDGARLDVRRQTPTKNSKETKSADEIAPIETLEPRIRLLAIIVSKLSGREIRLFDAGQLEEGSTAAEGGQAVSNTAPAAPPGVQGMRYEWSREVTRSESSLFAASGTLTTADGATIDIALALQMEYRHTERESLVITAGVQLKDPLVINFNGTAAELTRERLSFDIDADGELDSINTLSANSGLLMLDRNGDGRATDGSELFGALSGNGFADLARYDEDGNGFIDEGDSVYGRLKIWIRTAEGGDEYAGLQEKGVGALYLGSVSTPFSLYTEGNEMRGQIRSSGLYIAENGSVGTLQQIDLVV